jgi:hypothetical protein
VNRATDCCVMVVLPAVACAAQEPAMFLSSINSSRHQRLTTAESQGSRQAPRPSKSFSLREVWIYDATGHPAAIRHELASVNAGCSVRAA